jgi:ubiquinone/menaquinone biosynthesis C-methylase UbiE
LDIGCGNGKIAEYISDVSEAEVTGIDYIPEAIAQARRRTVSKQGRLHFMVRNLEQLDLESQSYDAIISIDSIFFGKEVKETVARLKGLLKVGGVMAVFCDETLGAALKENGLNYDAYDRSREHYGHLQLKHRVAQEMKEAFAEEGNGFIAENLLTESLDSPEPYDPGVWQITRYLYHVKAL